MSQANDDRFQQIRRGLFFIVGNHRGGTTLLQSMLTSHRQTTIPPETAFFRQVWPRRRQFGDLTQTANLQRMVAYLQSQACSVSELGLDSQEIVEAFQGHGRGCDDLFIVLLALYARRRGKTRVGEKGPQHIFYVPLLADLYPQAKFITVLRDPRAVVHSEMATSWGSRSAGMIARRWRRVVDQHFQLVQMMPANRYVLIQYEQLLQQTDETLHRLCRFLELDFDDSMLSYFERPADEEGFAAHEKWKRNTRRPLDLSRIDAWKSSLSATDVALIQRIAGCRLPQLGYPPADTGRLGRWASLRHTLWDSWTGTCEIIRSLRRKRRAPLQTLLAERLLRNVRPMGHS